MSDSWLADLLSASTVFDVATQKAKHHQKQSRMKRSPKKYQQDEDYENKKFLSINFEEDQTIQYFLKAVPEHAYSDKLFNDVEKLKVRHIPIERRVKIFSGFSEQQRINIEQRKSYIPIKTNMVPVQFRGRAEFQIQNGNNTQRFTLQSEDLEKLNPEVDLNDTILQNYLKILKLFLIPQDILRKTYFFSTFFMGQLMSDIQWKDEGQIGKEYEKKVYEEMKQKVEKNYEKVTRWGKKINIFQMDYLVVPINCNNHWNCLLIVHPNSLYEQKKRCRIIGLDSMFQIRPMLYDIFKVYLQLEMLNKHKVHIDTHSIPTWQLLLLRQTNYHDCGLYVLSYIETIFSNPHILSQIIQIKRKNYLSLFPRQLIFSMRIDLKNLLFNLMKNSGTSQKVDKIKGFLNERKLIIKNQSSQYEYDTIDQECFKKYCQLCPGSAQENEHHKLLLRFYLDGEINFYEKDQTKDFIAFSHF